MAGQIYSVRILELRQVPGSWRYYTVPAGYRVAIKCMVSVNGGPNPQNAYASIAGVVLLKLVLPANGSAIERSLQLVANAGEQVGLYNSSVDLDTSIHGFLFATAAAGERPAHEIVGDPEPRFPVEAQELPA